jgi:predicted DNA-binding transcriptional regulator AlpA
MKAEFIETLLDEKQLAEKLHLSVGTLRLWRTENKGPRYHKIGQLVRYSPTDIRDWLVRQQTGGDVRQAEVAQ